MTCLGYGPTLAARGIIRVIDHVHSRSVPGQGPSSHIRPLCQNPGFME